MTPLEIIKVLSFALGTLRTLADLYGGYRKRKQAMRDGLEILLYELETLVHDLEFNDSMKSYDELRLMELVFGIEEFVLSTQNPGKFAGFFLSAKKSDYYLSRINSFNAKVKHLNEVKLKSTQPKPEQNGGGGAHTVGLLGCCPGLSAPGAACIPSSGVQNQTYERCCACSDLASSSAAGESATESLFFGIPDPKKVIKDLLAEPVSSEQAGEQDAKQPPKVISIVGCPGVGKTALARAVYDHYTKSDSKHFECVAWADASGCNKTALLGKILHDIKVDSARRASDDDGNTGLSDPHAILEDRRYLVFIDDVQQAQVLEAILHDFPKNAKSSMLVVTTRFHRVANICTLGTGSRVYTMQRLPPDVSEKLLWAKVYDDSTKKPNAALSSGSESILRKCDGLPLALISVAKLLRTKGDGLVHDSCIRVGQKLGRHLVGEEAEDPEEAEAFRELRRAVGQCYEGLPGYDQKNCMLSLSIFPRNHPIKSNSLVRRLIAEGLVANSDPKTSDELITAINDGRQCLQQLVNRCVVEPVQNRSWSKDDKNCRVNGGIMLEYIIHKSCSRNLATLIREEEVVHNKYGSIRRLSVQSNSEKKFHEVEKNGLSGIRSLTIFSGNFFDPFKKTSNEIPLSKKIASNLFEKKDYKFLRLLDLEGCRGLDENLLLGICKLVYLKYLSLRNTDVKNIPTQIKKLLCLQTLDIRDTRKIELPEEVIMLPMLASLFGKFVLPEMSSETQKFLNDKSKLHTVAGFVLDEVKSYQKIILEATNLRKVKIWCDPPMPEKTPLNAKRADFSLSLMGRITSLESVSIDSSQLSQDILASIESGEPCKIRSMKLRGKLTKLHCTATLSMLNNLKKLQLSGTELSSANLSRLQTISCLEFLYLHEDKEEGSWDGSFTVCEGGFESLKRLCFEASKLPKLQFNRGSMTSLSSLHMLCPDISQMDAVDEISESIKHITSLKEVIFHSSADSDIVKLWKTAAMNNANRPRVTQLPKISSQLRDY